MVRLILFILIMGAVVMFFWHDEISGNFDGWQKQAEEKGPNLINQGLDQAKELENWWNENAKEKADELVASLTSQGKEKIDEWAEQNNFNQYGDPSGTMYTGGTPLFNEATGDSIDRYSYILLRHPNLIEDLELGKYFK